MNTARPLRLVAIAALVALLAACASSKKADRPAALTAFQSTAKVDVVWRANLLNSAPKLRLGLSLAMAGDVIYAANHAGIVFAFDKTTGKRLWRTATKLPLTAGPGVGEGLVVAGSGRGGIVALDATTGAVKWKSSVTSELLAAPAISKQVILLRAVDGRVLALRTSDGSQIWSVEKKPPALTLRGTARPAIAGDIALSGFDNGHLAAWQLADGTDLWDTIVAQPSGRTELERLNDIDTQLAIRGKDVYVVTFQGKVARIDLDTGQALWSRDESSYSGLALDDDAIYITDSGGGVVKLLHQGGAEAWNTKVLSHRRLSPPAVLGKLVATADLDGYVHFLDGATGDLAARIHVLSSRVTTEPVVSGDTLYMLDDTGHLAAMRATPVAAGAGSITPTGSQTQQNNAVLRPR